MIKPFNDVKSYQSYWIDLEDYLDLLDPSIGEKAAMQLGRQNITVKEHWKPLDVTLFQNDGTVDIPDISLWRGMLCMNGKSYDALHELLEAYGEFLPCKVLGKKGYLFHCLNIREFQDNEVSYRMYGEDYAEVESLSFPPDMKDHVIKGIDKMHSNLYFSDEIENIIKRENLKGLLLIQDINVSLPY